MGVQRVVCFGRPQSLPRQFFPQPGCIACFCSVFSVFRVQPGRRPKVQHRHHHVGGRLIPRPLSLRHQRARRRDFSFPAHPGIANGVLLYLLSIPLLLSACVLYSEGCQKDYWCSFYVFFHVQLPRRNFALCTHVRPATIILRPPFFVHCGDHTPGMLQTASHFFPN